MTLESRLRTTKHFQRWELGTLLDILENMEYAVIVIDYEGTVVYINRFYAECMRVNPERLLGRSLYEIEPQAKLLRVMEESADFYEPEEGDGVRKDCKKPALPLQLDSLKEEPASGNGPEAMEYIQSLNIDSVGHAFPLYNSQRKKIGGCAIFKDVTEIVRLTRRLQKSKEMVQYLASQLETSELPISFQSYISLNRNLKKSLELAAKVSPTNCTVLIQGESGVGKEVMAKCIHGASPRKDRPMIKVNCASIPENLLESELFGYEDGAFTGAKRGGKLGKFELANKGTILLDEIGDMSLSMQAKLLRVLQEKELERVGGTKTIKLDVRVIASTNRNLEEMVEKKEFRGDLYYRLHVVPIYIPPLRERREDIMPLVRYFIQHYGGDDNTDLTPGATRILEENDWPGNVRELQNVIEFAMIVRSGNIIEIKDLPQYLRGDCYKEEKETAEPRRLKDAIEDLERQMIRDALTRNKGNKSIAINELGLSRRSFYEKLEKYGLR
ncbi:MAG: sigma 54-interacting transcriptional regulator [Lachnospiraceae bacterium]|jgi:transcriptional regulator with PAS, ATPase and Fis domain|nr:sigma 54-interacting transcriptional regulator [Lachnospiraceae bacterium]